MNQQIQAVQPVTAQTIVSQIFVRVMSTLIAAGVLALVMWFFED